MSRRPVVVTFTTTPKAFNTATFCQFLRQLASNIDTQRSLILMDNCSIHNANAVKTLCAELNLHTVRNVPYRPEFNGIEDAWAIIKKDFRKKVLKIKTGVREPRMLTQVVKESIEGVSQQAVKAACHHALKMIARAQMMNLGVEE